MRHVKLVLPALVLAAALPLLSGHGGEPKDDGPMNPRVSRLMRQKLSHSQKVLEGVATGDCKMIADNAEELIAISKEAEWRVLKTPSYEIHSDDFRRAAEDLVKTAKNRNLDATAINYVDLTLTCVKCHKYVREERMVRRD